MDAFQYSDTGFPIRYRFDNAIQPREVAKQNIVADSCAIRTPLCR